MNKLPLSGIKVIEIAHIVAGPTAGLILGDLGAEVIKVEPPNALDASRIGSSRNGSFFFVNRNKSSIVIDLKSTKGLEVLHKILEDTDVLIENMAPGTMSRLGIGYNQLSSKYPELIYLSVKGFLSGPYSNQTSLDELAQMGSGLAYMTGRAGDPIRAGASIVDMGAAMHGVIGVLSALYTRYNTKMGQEITSGLFETALFFVGQHMAFNQHTGNTNVPLPERHHGWGVYDKFECNDGKLVFIGVTSNNQWNSFCKILKLNNLANNEELKDNPGRIANRPLILKTVTPIIESMASNQILDLLRENGISATLVHTPDTVINDPHVNSDKRLFKFNSDGKDFALPKLPYESSQYNFDKLLPAPDKPGLQTNLILTNLGYTDSEISKFFEDNIVQ
jgi:crotonobetainyl-CoA:carnitine CoA-transferase CaiB-like acyl-CoA transferase